MLSNEPGDALITAIVMLHLPLIFGGGGVFVWFMAITCAVAAIAIGADMAIT